MRSVTQKDIAEDTGFSLMTVSRALRGSPKVSKRTKKVISEAAERLGYTPDPMLSALVNYRNRKTSGYHKLALLSAFPSERDWHDRHMSGRKTMKGIQEACKAYGFVTEIFNLNEVGGKLSRLLDILHARGIESVILFPTPEPLSNVFKATKAEWDRFQIVQIGYSETEPRCQYVWPDQFETITTLWDELWNRGYRRIGFEMNRRNIDRIHGLWEGAFLYKQHQAYPDVSPTPILKHEGLSQEIVSSYIKKYKLDAMIAGSGRMYSCIVESGLHIPEDVGLVNVAVHESEDHLAGMVQQRENMGRSAVDLIHRLKLDRQFGEAKEEGGVYLKGKWKPGPTVRELPK